MVGSKTVNVEKKAEAKATPSKSCSKAKQNNNRNINHCFICNVKLLELLVVPARKLIATKGAIAYGSK